MEINTEEAAARAHYEAAKEEMEQVLKSHYDQLEIKDFVADLPSGKYRFKPTRELWPAVSVNAKIPPIMPGEPGNDTGKPMPATEWLKRHVCVEQTVWAPGQKEVIQNKILTEAGFINRQGCAAFNIYEAPTIVAGDPKKAMPWLAHVRTVYPDEQDTYEFIGFCAHAVQKPGEKVNHALVMASRWQGIGKDTLLEPVRHGVGLRNFQEVSPKQLMGRFNG